MRTGIIDLYLECQLDVVKKLVDNGKINLSHVLCCIDLNFQGDYQKFIEFQKDQKNVRFDEITNYIYDENIIELSKISCTINEKLLADVKHIESLFYRITDRGASIPISVHERKLYYLLLLNYFNTLIVEHKFELIIAFDTPHSFASIIYHELAKYYGIKVVLIEYHYLEDLSVIINQYEFPRVPINFLKNESLEETKKRVPDFLMDKLENRNAYVANYKEREKRNLRYKSSGIGLLLSLIFKKLTNLIIGFFPFLIKKHLLHFTSLNSISSSLKYRVTINRLITKLFVLNNYYRKISIDPELDCNYIFYGLHMQPEKTSQPLGNESDNQFYPIFFLSKNLPKGWKLYVKEHPNQFNLRKVSNRNYRSKNFYKAILKLDNVCLVSQEVSADELIRKSRAIATLTGTIGWEGLEMGKPVLAFGNPYYLGCKSVYHLLNEGEVRRFFRKIDSITTNEVKKDFYKYLIYYYEKGYISKGACHEVKIVTSIYSRNWHLKHVYESIVKRIEELKL